MNHTPGPWRAGSEPHHYPDGTTQTFHPETIYAFRRSGEILLEERAIATVYGIWNNRTLESIRDDPRCAEGLANARLIVRAVNCHAKLLGALKAVLPYVAFGESNTPGGWVARLARLAIAEAEEDRS